MTVQDFKNRINSISNHQSRYLKNSALNICDDLLSSKLLTKSGKITVQNIKTAINGVNDPFLYSSQANERDLNEIIGCLNILDSLLE